MQVGLVPGVLLDHPRIFQATVRLVLGTVWPTEGAYELLFPNDSLRSWAGISGETWELS